MDLRVESLKERMGVDAKVRQADLEALTEEERVALGREVLKDAGVDVGSDDVKAAQLIGYGLVGLIRDLRGRIPVAAVFAEATGLLGELQPFLDALRRHRQVEVKFLAGLLKEVMKEYSLGEGTALALLQLQSGAARKVFSDLVDAVRDAKKE